MQVRVGVEMLVVLAVVLLAPSVTEGLVLNKCELRQQLNLTLLADHINEVAKIVCHAELSSHLNTRAVNQIPAPQGDRKPRFSRDAPGSFPPFPSPLPHNESQEHNSVGNQTDHKDVPARPEAGGRPDAGVRPGAGDRPAPGGRPGAGGPPAPGGGPGAGGPPAPGGQKKRPSRSAPETPKHPSKNKSQEHNTVGSQTGQHKDDHSHPGPSVQPKVSKSTPAAGSRPAPGGHPGAAGQKNRHRRSAQVIPKRFPSTPPHNKPQEHAGAGNQTGQNNDAHSHPGASPSSLLAAHNESQEHPSGSGNRKPRSPKAASAPIKNSPSHNVQAASPKPGVPGQPKPSAESIRPPSSKSPPPGSNHPNANGSLKLEHNNQGFPKQDSPPHNESSEHQRPVPSFNISQVNQTNHHEKEGHDQGHGGRKSRSVKPIGETSHEQHGDDTWTLYGLFQLADHVACLSEKPSLNLCGLSCDKLIDDDITDDIACVETIVGNPMSTINDHRKELIKSMYDLIHQKECANVVDLPYFSSC